MLCALAFGEQADRLDFLSRVWSALLRGVWASLKPNDRELRVGHVSSRRLSPARVHHQVARNSCNNYQILCSYFGLVRPAQAFNSSAMLGNWHISLIIVIIINLSANVASSKYIQKKATKKEKKKIETHEHSTWPAYKWAKWIFGFGFLFECCVAQHTDMQHTCALFK